MRWTGVQDIWRPRRLRRSFVWLVLRFFGGTWMDTNTPFLICSKPKSREAFALSRFNHFSGGTASTLQLSTSAHAATELMLHNQTKWILSENQRVEVRWSKAITHLPPFTTLALCQLRHWSSSPVRLNMQICARLCEMLRPDAADGLPSPWKKCFWTVPVSLGAECQLAHGPSQQAQHLHNNDIIP